jgi:hypothetical protein
MSDADFDRAMAIAEGLPGEGPIDGEVVAEFFGLISGLPADQSVPIMRYVYTITNGEISRYKGFVEWVMREDVTNHLRMEEP